jgi:hypothetical protein
MAELVARPDDEWDTKMKANAESGKLDFVDRNIDESVAKGTTLSLDTGFGKEA